jgi:serine/threonine-protein kinase
VREQRLAVAISVWETKIGPWGQVLSQDPEPGSLVRTGSRVTLVVAGRPHLTVPDVRGLPHMVAMDILRRAGLRPEVSTERGSRSVARGEVIATVPRVGSLVTDGTRIALEVSRGLSR